MHSWSRFGRDMKYGSEYGSWIYSRSDYVGQIIWCTQHTTKRNRLISLLPWSCLLWTCLSIHVWFVCYDHFAFIYWLVFVCFHPSYSVKVDKIEFIRYSHGVWLSSATVGLAYSIFSIFRFGMITFDRSGPCCYLAIYYPTTMLVLLWLPQHIYCN